GLHPLLDPRLMWCTVLGSGGVRELLWIERQEGYSANFLERQGLGAGDTILVYSHGGLNAAPIEVAMEAKKRGLSVVAVTSLANAAQAKATHSSGKRLADVADITIDNCVPPQDALISIDGVSTPVAAGSTVTAISISMALVAEIAAQLARRGFALDTFVSPNVAAVEADHNLHVFDQHEKLMRTLPTRTQATQ
ncbi:MAG TPA: sugar isomerase domain-containing protein, partial [Chloroflexota bacterium]|nr:sugar isomerase domain-containing protein [Chloroflexota bacterium]